MIPENADEVLQLWREIGERVKQVRHSAGMTSADFAQELGTSSLCIDLMENVGLCDTALILDPEEFAKEMRWDILLERISERFIIPEGWLCAEQESESLSVLKKYDMEGTDDEIVITVPLTISQSVLLEGVKMIVETTREIRSGQHAYDMINAWQYRMLTDLFRLYYHVMKAYGRSDIAGQTTEVMLKEMKRHPLYQESTLVIKCG